MFQSQIIEFEKYQNCKKHNQPIQFVVFNNNLKREEYLLCNICRQDFEGERVFELQMIVKMIEDNLKIKVENIERLIKVDLDLTQQLLEELRMIKQKLNSQLDELISNTVDWNKNLNVWAKNLQFQFLDELEIVKEQINTSKQNIFDSEQLINSITKLNNSHIIKNNTKLTTLKNLDMYVQCEQILQNLDFAHHIKSIDNQIKQLDSCYAISFNQSGSLMISASNQYIKVWDFVQGKMKEITTLDGHVKTIHFLLFSKKSNSFLSAGSDNTIRCWKEIYEKQWKSSQPYQKHTQSVDCLILNEPENQFVSGGSDCSIKIWQIDLIRNQLTHLYSLDRHKNQIISLSFNQLENKMVSCGLDNQIIIWQKYNQKEWQFEQIVTQTFLELKYRFQFINNDQLICVNGNQVSQDSISIFESNNGIYKENLNKQVQLIKNDKFCDLAFFPIFYHKEKNLIIIKHKQHVYLIKTTNEGQLKIITSIQFQSNEIYGALTNDGKYLVTWNKMFQKYDSYEIQIS
ncbi:unnamed protein product [Paramecium sonneborni]|uniref:Uncharacterized protein n=1 Tax=Paramecium sonneborni TaxID=65129 RepID=A0A8S1QQN6_9CILI|nr:unnamed protein product [Paramecium sonneborni]CAD8118059.1 unnamed protein product [Paramecium sonneborni]